MQSYGHRIQVEFEEDSRSAFVMFDFAGVMGYAVLMGMEWRGTRCNVGRWDNVQEVLVGDEVFFPVSGISRKNNGPAYFYQ